MATDLQKVIEDVRSLPAEDQRRLRDVLDEQLGAAGRQFEPDEARFKQELVKAGLLKHIKPPVRDLAPYRHRKPLQIDGPPLSETIIQERR
jgi:hypothetical protein